MAKALALLNQDIAQAYRVHSLTTPPEAVELSELDKKMGEVLCWNKNGYKREFI